MALAVLELEVPFSLVDEAGLAALDEFLRNGVRWENLADLPGGEDMSVNQVRV
jgi:hypothetical protein